MREPLCWNFIEKHKKPLVVSAKLLSHKTDEGYILLSYYPLFHASKKKSFLTKENVGC